MPNRWEAISVGVIAGSGTPQNPIPLDFTCAPGVLQQVIISFVTCQAFAVTIRCAGQTIIPTTLSTPTSGNRGLIVCPSAPVTIQLDVDGAFEGGSWGAAYAASLAAGAGAFNVLFGFTDSQPQRRPFGRRQPPSLRSIMATGAARSGAR